MSRADLVFYTPEAESCHQNRNPSGEVKSSPPPMGFLPDLIVSLLRDMAAEDIEKLPCLRLIFQIPETKHERVTCPTF
jgi:hypothetical protein